MINKEASDKQHIEESPIRSFSEEYKRSMDQITLSPELRERILKIEGKKHTPRWIKVMKPVVSAAACFALLFTARGWLGIQSNSLSSAEANLSAASIQTYGTDGSSAVITAETGDTAEEIAPGDLPETAEEDTETALETYDAGEETDTDSISRSVSTPADETSEPAIASHDSKAGASSAAFTTPPAVLGESVPADPKSGESTASGSAPSEENTEEAANSEIGVFSTEETSQQISVDNQNTDTISNPKVGYTFLSEIESVLGWNVKAPSLDGSSLYLINGTLFEADWEDGRYFRMAKTSECGEDISGDFNSYGYTVTQEISGISVTLYGTEEKEYLLLIWQEGEFSFAYSSPTPMTAAEAYDFMEGLTLQ